MAYYDKKELLHWSIAGVVFYLVLRFFDLILSPSNNKILDWKTYIIQVFALLLLLIAIAMFQAKRDRLFPILGPILIVFGIFSYLKNWSTKDSDQSEQSTKIRDQC